MKKIGYLRISTKDQHIDRQVIGLREICDELHIEQISAGKQSRSRPVFSKVMRRLQSGDMLVVWDVDRAFRSTVDAINQAKALLARGVHFKIMNLQVDTSTPNGMLVYSIISAVAEHERAVLIQRTREGIAAARRNGKHIGRPYKLSADDISEARHRLTRGNITISALARELKVGRSTLSRALKSKRYEDQSSLNDRL